MGVRESFRKFTRELADYTDRLSRRYDIPGMGYDIVGLAPDEGNGITASVGTTSTGLTKLEILWRYLSDKEVLRHESRHLLMPPNLIGGIYDRVKGGVANISAAIAEASVVEGQVDDDGIPLSNLEGYAPIKEGLYRLGRKVADAAGGAKRLYHLVRDRAQQGLVDLINSRPDVAREFRDFYNSYNPNLLQRYGMFEPALAPARVDGYNY